MLAVSPSIVKRAEQPYISIPIRVTLKEWGKANALVPELFEWLGRNNLQLAGPPFFRYWILGDGDEEFSIEVGMPLAAPVDGDGRVIAGSIPAGTYASYVHHGHPDQLPVIYEEFDKWLRDEGVEPSIREANGDQIWDGRFEFFMTNPADEPDPNNWDTEVAWLVRADRTTASAVGAAGR